MKEGKELKFEELNMINGGFVKYSDAGSTLNLYNDKTSELIASYSLKTVEDQQQAIINVQNYHAKHPEVSAKLRLMGNEQLDDSTF